MKRIAQHNTQTDRRLLALETDARALWSLLKEDALTVNVNCRASAHGTLFWLAHICFLFLLHRRLLHRRVLIHAETYRLVAAVRPCCQQCLARSAVLSEAAEAFACTLRSWHVLHPSQLCTDEPPLQPWLAPRTQAFPALWGRCSGGEAHGDKHTGVKKTTAAGARAKRKIGVVCASTMATSGRAREPSAALEQRTALYGVRKNTEDWVRAANTCSHCTFFNGLSPASAGAPPAGGAMCSCADCRAFRPPATKASSESARITSGRGAYLQKALIFLFL